MINWSFDFRPKSFDEMALYPLLRKRLEFYEKTGDFSHLILAGDTGVGKTTAARILGSLSSFSTIEEDCARDNTKARMLKIAKGTTAGTIFGTRRLIIMDEFHEIPLSAQKVFNKTMEDRNHNTLFIFCVNDIDKVADPIVSRCLTLNFDVGSIPKNKKTLAMKPYVDMTKEEWTDELFRITRVVANKAGLEVSDKQLNEVASNEFYLTDCRRFIRAVEELVKMENID